MITIFLPVIIGTVWVSGCGAENNKGSITTITEAITQKRSISRNPISFETGDTTLPTLTGIEARNPLKTLEIALGRKHSCALLDNGSIKCWGSEIGFYEGDINLREGIRKTPLLIPELLLDAKHLFAGDTDTCALSSADRLFCVGEMAYKPNESPYRGSKEILINNEKVKKIGAGFSYACALMETGNIYCWGGNYFGGLGNGSDAPGSDTPVMVRHFPGKAIDITVGFDYSCAITEENMVYCWGSNVVGQLGAGTTEKLCNIPIQVQYKFQTIKSIDAGSDHTCAVLLSGEIVCWGFNGNGQVGDGTRINRYSPVAVNGLSREAIAVAAGYEHTCSLMKDGSVECWGKNDVGQLGDGTMRDSTSPVKVIGIFQKVISISAGAVHTCALKEDGNVICWGSNEYGEIGDGTKENRSSPVDVEGLFDME